ECGVRLGQERVQLDRLLRGSSHLGYFVAEIVTELTRSGRVSRGETRISGSKRRIFGDHLAEGIDTVTQAHKATPQLQRARAKVQIVSFGAGLIASASAPQLASQAITIP